MAEQDLMEKIVSLCKRRGFIFQSSEIYGGLNGFWDYGPLGVELKRNVKEAWWRDMVTTRENVVGIDASIIMHPNVWRASGHAAGFADPLKTAARLSSSPKIQAALNAKKEAESIRTQAAARAERPLDVEVQEVKPNITRAMTISSEITVYQSQQHS